MAHAWWHIGTGPEYGTEEFYDQPGEPDVAAAMDWARIRAEQEDYCPIEVHLCRNSYDNYITFIVKCQVSDKSG